MGGSTQQLPGGCMYYRISVKTGSKRARALSEYSQDTSVKRKQTSANWLHDLVRVFSLNLHFGDPDNAREAQQIQP